jgi:hypothetical protein
MFGFQLLKAQEYTSVGDSSFSLSGHDCERLSSRWVKKFKRTTIAVKRVNDKYLNEFFELEDKLIRGLCPIDEAKAESHFRSSLHSFRRFEERLSSSSDSQIGGKYNGLDSLSSALDFLDRTEDEQNNSDSCGCASFDDVRAAQLELRKELRRSEVIQDYISDRTNYLGRINNSNDKFDANVLNLQKSNYYLGESLKNRVSILDVRSPLEKSIFQKLNSTNLFKDFVTSQQGVDGLAIASMGSSEKPTKLSIDNLLAQAQSNISKEIDSKNIDLLEKLKATDFEVKKDTLTNLRKKENENKKREWKPNPYKSKRFIERFSYGLDFQVTRRTQILPSAGAFTGSVIFNYSPDFSVALNAGAITSVESLNFDREFDMPRVSNEGLIVGLNVDQKVYQKLFVTGGLELNNRVVDSDIEVISNASVTLLATQWNTSALVGMKLRLPSGKSREQTFSIVYDVLHHRTGLPPFSVRMGMNFLPKR